MGRIRAGRKPLPNQLILKQICCYLYHLESQLLSQYGGRGLKDLEKKWNFLQTFPGIFVTTGVTCNQIWKYEMTWSGSHGTLPWGSRSHGIFRGRKQFPALLPPTRPRPRREPTTQHQSLTFCWSFLIFYKPSMCLVHFQLRKNGIEIENCYYNFGTFDGF